MRYYAVMVNSASQSPEPDSTERLLAALNGLELVLSRPGSAALAVANPALDALSLTLSALRKLTQPGAAVMQIAVLGPTQAGKSTLVNALCQQEVTSVSALAGHTRHARGAGFNIEPQWLDWLDDALAPAQRVTGSELDPTDMDQYSLTQLAQALPDSLPILGSEHSQAVIWDTPDFDSLTAQAYRRAVLSVAGLADLIILIASRDKYGDMAVWQTLAALRPLNRYGLFVVNKVEAPQWPELADHIGSTQEQRFGSKIYQLAHIPQAATGTAVDLAELRQALGAAKVIEPTQLRRGIEALCTAHWSAWTAPILAEVECSAEWRDRITAAREQFLEAYRRDYLADVDRYDTFARLVAQLLVLLEIPALARTMGNVRRLVTWPIRKLRETRAVSPDLGREPELLRDGAAHALLQLRTQLLQPDTAHPIWAEVSHGLLDTAPQITEHFSEAAAAHHASFQSNVDAAADRLFERLQEQPLVLNGLRAVRASADAAGVVVALQTGGIGLSDLVLTPVMLSLTTTLTESAARGYVDQVMDELKEQQYTAVTQLFDDALAQPLQAHFESHASASFSGLDMSELTAALQDFGGRLAEDAGVHGEAGADTVANADANADANAMANDDTQALQEGGTQ